MSLLCFLLQNSSMFHWSLFEWSHKKLNLQTKSATCQSLSIPLHSEMIDSPGLQYPHTFMNQIINNTIVNSCICNFSDSCKAFFPLSLNFKSH